MNGIFDRSIWVLLSVSILGSKPTSRQNSHFITRRSLIQGLLHFVRVRNLVSERQTPCRRGLYYPLKYAQCAISFTVNIRGKLEANEVLCLHDLQHSQSLRSCLMTDCLHVTIIMVAW